MLIFSYRDKKYVSENFKKSNYPFKDMNKHIHLIWGKEGLKRGLSLKKENW